MIYAGVDFISALSFCVVPFLPGDGIKCVVLNGIGEKATISFQKSISFSKPVKKEPFGSFQPVEKGHLLVAFFSY